MKKIAYLHGLEGNLTDEKRKVLEKYGQVFAPEIDYRKKEILLELSGIFWPCDIFIGSSMGGYVGFKLSLIFDKPCLLFNPAFPYRTIEPDMSSIVIPDSKCASTTIILGKNDFVIKYTDNLRFINQLIKNENLKIIEIENLEHRIPLEIFEESISKFFKEQIQFM